MLLLDIARPPFFSLPPGSCFVRVQSVNFGKCKKHSCARALQKHIAHASGIAFYKIRVYIVSWFTELFAAKNEEVDVEEDIGRAKF